jgi:simple sugar transport system permease protein
MSKDSGRFVKLAIRRLLLSWPLGNALRTAGVLIGALSAGVSLLWILGFAPGTALRALWFGSLGSWYALTSGTLVRATPLVFTGLSVAIAFRAGVFSIGAEGQLLVGAALAAAIAVPIGPRLGAVTIPLELLAGGAAGAGWAAVAALLRHRFRVLEVISTLLLNFVSVFLVGFLVRGPLQEPLRVYPQSAALSSELRLPKLLPASRLHVGFVIALMMAVFLWWYLRFTASGFRLRAVGANPNAARIAGEIDVEKVTFSAFLASGALSGLAGAIELTGVTFALYENISPGYGYTGIAVALLARLHPLLVVVSATLFGALETGATAMQRDANVPSVVVSIAEAVIILGLVILWRSPVGTGRTFDSAPSMPDEAQSPGS